MAVKAFASKWAGPFALLKVFTSFFSEKQKERIRRTVGRSGVQVNHCLPPSLSEPGQPQVGGARCRFPSWTVPAPRYAATGPPLCFEPAVLQRPPGAGRPEQSSGPAVWAPRC